MASLRLTCVSGLQRLAVHAEGVVQGVGFRPFVYGLATELGLTGWVKNSSAGVSVEVEGDRPALEQFIARLQADKPNHSRLTQVDVDWLSPCGYSHFEIRDSQNQGSKTALILPDLATCPDCLREMRDPSDRRYRYPFTNCTHCGPRFSILRSLPYDRPNTTMAGFQMCRACQAEYHNPRDRRFHAQPTACPACGPQLALWDRAGNMLATGDDALLAAADALCRGDILALKGLGGFHLMVDARNGGAVHRLRRRKHRPDKPLALMYPSLTAVKQDCWVSELEASLLTSPAAPIVLLERRPEADLPPAIAPGNPNLGVMLPYTPLHHLLLEELEFPVVATSGNQSSEPICIDETDALRRLGAIADVFLVHDRPIARPVDDSIVRVMAGEPGVLRRARGYAPLSLSLPPTLAAEDAVVLGVGGHLKNTVAVAHHRTLILSQHLGDLENLPTVARFREAIAQLTALYDVQPQAIGCDAHPDYHATQFAHTLGATVIPVQHHYAHVLACLLENQVEPPVLGIAWDGTGYGLDGTLWGGEFLQVPAAAAAPAAGFVRFGSLAPFRLPGGELAVREPRRSALGLLVSCLGEAAWSLDQLAPLRAFESGERSVLRTMVERELNSPLTSSAGRWFDAVASLLDLCQVSTFEGQGAMALEAAIAGYATDAHYAYTLEADPQGRWLLNLRPAISEILADQQRGVPVSAIAAQFHNTLVAGMVALARKAGVEAIALTGGCFQNRYLLEHAIKGLQAAGFKVYWHRRIPPNDGGLAIGQVAAVLRSPR